MYTFNTQTEIHKQTHHQSEPMTAKNQVLKTPENNTETEGTERRQPYQNHWRQ